MVVLPAGRKAANRKGRSLASMHQLTVSVKVPPGAALQGEHEMDKLVTFALKLELNRAKTNPNDIAAKRLGAWRNCGRKSSKHDFVIEAGLCAQR